MCEEILVDKIICDEFFRVSNYDKGIKIENIIVPENSTVGGTVEVAILGCTPVISKDKDRICAEIELFIQKELLITTPDSQEIRLEFGFRVTKTVCFRQCTPGELCAIDPRLLKNLECRVMDISTIKDSVTLHPSSGTIGASFDELLIIKLQLMLVQRKRLPILACPVLACPCEPICPPKRVCYPVPVCPPQRCKCQGTVLPPSTCCLGYLSCLKTV